MVLLHPDDGSVESWTAEGSSDKMRYDFRDFEPRIQKLLSFVPSTLKWKLMDRDPLTTCVCLLTHSFHSPLKVQASFRWIHPKGRIVLLGDACHPMLPYRAQGAAMAVRTAIIPILPTALVLMLSHRSKTRLYSARSFPTCRISTNCLFS